MVYSEYAPVEENQNKKHEFYPMETAILVYLGSLQYHKFEVASQHYKSKILSSFFITTLEWFNKLK